MPSLEQVLENNRFYDFVADHRSYFSKQTLHVALEKNGFQVFEINRDWGGEHLVALVKKPSQTDFDSVRSAVDQLIDEFTQLVHASLAKGKRVAIWGASYHALTLLALSCIEGISYVIDSAPYKQGRFTPVSHIPIVAPGTLKSAPVELVIVMASRYSSEIMGQLRTDLQFSGAIALLEGNRFVVT